MATLQTISRNFLGFGPIAPLRRLGGADFVMGDGIALVQSTIRQIIGTVVGELKWKPGFGVDIASKRNKINNDAVATQLKNDLSAAIKLWEPRIESTVTTVTTKENALYARIRWQLINSNVQGNQVILGPNEFEARI